MKKNILNIYKKVIIAVAGIAVIGCLGGCSAISNVNYEYENGDKYTAGNREITEKIENIDIDYISGDITLSQSDAQNVNITETSKTQLDDKRKVHTWVDGSTLHVRYCASAKNLNLNNLEKKLSIELPKGTDLDNLNIDVSSGDSNIDCVATNYSLHATSGDINLTQSGNSELIDIDVSSGDISVKGDTVNKISVNSTSGKQKIDVNNVKDIATDSTSGDGNFTFKELPATSNFKATSGELTINIPKDSDLTATIDTTSGNINTNHSFSIDGKKYCSGNGKNNMNIDVTSGDVKINDIAD